MRPVRTEADYEAALAQIELLWGAKEGTEKADKLDVLLVLVEDYERKNHPVPAPDPIEAIKEVMRIKNYTRNDLIPLIGNRSKVSEVLSRKRPLSISMIRALHTTWGIPADILIENSTLQSIEESSINWDSFPLKEIIKRGWAQARPIKEAAEEIGKEFFRNASYECNTQCAACFRSGLRHNSKSDAYALQAWLLGVRIEALKQQVPSDFKKELFTSKQLEELVKLSVRPDGPIAAQSFLNAHGIRLVCVKHLKRTHIDGAVFWLAENQPVIALTLRYDRLDNFWFTLLHEASHIVLGHLDHKPGEAIIDDLEIEPTNNDELEADALAREIEIPDHIWQESDARKKRSKKAVYSLAESLGISPAIVAGRVRFHTRNYKLMARDIGTGEVRKLFWE